MNKFLNLISKGIIFLFKFFSILFLIIVIVDGIIRVSDAPDTILINEYEIVEKYSKDNFVILNSFLFQKKNNETELNLRYTLIPYGFKAPTTLNISSINNETESNNGRDYFSIIASILFILFGVANIYPILMFVFSKDFKFADYNNYD